MTKFENLAILNDAKFDEVITEFISKCDEWHKMSEDKQREFIVPFKRGFGESVINNIKLLQEYNMNSSWEFMLEFYKKAIEILDLNMRTSTVKSEQELSQLESNINQNFNLMRNYIDKANEFESKIREKIPRNRQTTDSELN